MVLGDWLMQSAPAGATAEVAKAVVPKYAVAPLANRDPHKVKVNAGSFTWDRCVFEGLKMVTSDGVVLGEIVMVNGNSFDTVLSGFRT